MSKASEDYMRRLVEEKRQSMQDLINETFDALVNFENTNKPKINEAFFIANFLPYVCGEKTDPKELDQFRNFYLQIAVVPNTPIDVMDANNNLLFTLPPLFSTDFIQSMADSELSYGDIVKFGALLGNITPHAQNNHLLNSLTEKGQAITGHIDTATEERHKKQWLIIFKRYNKVDAIRRLGVSGDTTSTPIKPQSNTSDDEYDYDFSDD